MAADWSYVKALAVESEAGRLRPVAHRRAQPQRHQGPPRAVARLLDAGARRRRRHRAPRAHARRPPELPLALAHREGAVDARQHRAGPHQPQRRQLVVEGRGEPVRRAVRRPRRPLRAHRGVADGPAPPAHRGHRHPHRRALRPAGLRDGAQAVGAADRLHGRRVAQGQGGHRPPRRGVRHARRRPRRHRGQDRRHGRPLGRRTFSYGVSGYVIVRDTEEEAQAELARILDVKASPGGVRVVPGLRRRQPARVAGVARGVLGLEPRAARRPRRHARAGHRPHPRVRGGRRRPDAAAVQPAARGDGRFGEQVIAGMRA